MRSLLLLILIVSTSWLKAQNDSLELKNRDSCIRSYALQVEQLANRYFHPGFLSELRAGKRIFFIKVTPSLRDSFTLQVFPRGSDTSFRHTDLKGFEAYVKKHGKFPYCFIVDICGSTQEDTDHILPPTEEETTEAKKKRQEEARKWLRNMYGQPVQFTFPIPYPNKPK